MSVLPHLHRVIVIELGYCVVGLSARSIISPEFGFSRISEELALFGLITAKHRISAFADTTLPVQGRIHPANVGSLCVAAS